jgi:diguanylate cyclase (GGDEF)-like protein/PAS domain S-box-containing protein
MIGKECNTATVDDIGKSDGFPDVQHQGPLINTGALQSAIFNSANFSSIATDAKGVIQIFNVGAERMLGYTADEVTNKITPADISDPQEVIARAESLSVELETPIAPGFEALVFKASRGIEDIYELTYIRKDGSRFPAVVSVTALRDAQDDIIGYLLIGTDNTARKQAEEALLKAGALQSAIFNSANFSSIATDARGVIQIFNVGAERMLGYEAADVMNKITPADISDPDELIARARALSTELLTQIAPGFEALVFKASRGIEDIYELTYIRKDGSRFPAVVSVTALRDAQDDIIGYLLIGTDNTARKRIEAEQKLLEAEQKQLSQRLRDHHFYTRSLFESNIDALMATDPSGIITDVNKQMEELTGCTRDELIGAPFKNYFTDPERAEAGIKQVLSEKKLANYELTARDRDGKETPVSYNARTLYDRDRRLQGVFAAVRDITERKQAEQQILNLASHDALTHLPNRRLFNDRLDFTMANGKRSRRYSALMFLDLDNFKTVNDLHGHNVGDLLLIETAQRISSCLRAVDTVAVARFGGDEFAVILNELDVDRRESNKHANLLAEKVRTILNKKYLLKYQLEGKAETTVEHHCTASIGVVLFLNHTASQHDLLKWGDIAMYEAKEAGRNSIRFYEPG